MSATDMQSLIGRARELEDRQLLDSDMYYTLFPRLINTVTNFSSVLREFKGEEDNEFSMRIHDLVVEDRGFTFKFQNEIVESIQNLDSIISVLTYSLPIKHPTETICLAPHLAMRHAAIMIERRSQTEKTLSLKTQQIKSLATFRDHCKQFELKLINYGEESDVKYNNDALLNLYPDEMVDDDDKKNIFEKISRTIEAYKDLVTNKEDSYKKFFFRNDDAHAGLRPKEWDYTDDTNKKKWKDYVLALRNLHDPPRPTAYSKTEKDEDDDINWKQYDIFTFFISDYRDPADHVHDNHAFVYIVNTKNKVIVRFNTSEDTYNLVGDKRFDDDTTMKKEIGYLFNTDEDELSNKRTLNTWGKYFSGYKLINAQSSGWQQDVDTCATFSWYFIMCYFFNIENIQTLNHPKTFHKALSRMKIDNQQVSTFFLESLGLIEQVQKN